VKVRIGGGADSLEFWYFGPFTDGDSLTLYCSIQQGYVILFSLLPVHLRVKGQDPTACDNDVPLYIMDFSESNWNTGGGGGGNENVDDVFLVMTRQACRRLLLHRCSE
jgi:hypothetical protein